MRRLVPLMTALLLAPGSGTIALACPCHSRGIRLDRAYTASHPATLLIYVSQKNAKSILRNPELQSILKRAGHKLQTVQEGARPDLKSGKFDLVLAEYDDAI